MLMRPPPLTHVQKSRVQRQGIGPNPQGHACSGLHCCGILPRHLHFYSPSNSPRIQGKRGWGEAKTPPGVLGIRVSLLSFTCGSASSLAHALLPNALSKRRRRPRHESSESTVCKENTPSALPHGCAFIRLCTEEDFSLVAQTLFTAQTQAPRSLSLYGCQALSLSWQQAKNAPERHLNIDAVMEGYDASLANPPAAFWTYVILKCQIDSPLRQQQGFFSINPVKIDPYNIKEGSDASISQMCSSPTTTPPSSGNQ